MMNSESRILNKGNLNGKENFPVNIGYTSINNKNSLYTFI